MARLRQAVNATTCRRADATTSGRMRRTGRPAGPPTSGSVRRSVIRSVVDGRWVGGCSPTARRLIRQRISSEI